MSEVRPRGAGRSSFDLIDQKRFLGLLDPVAGVVVLDLGSGKGNYALPIAEAIGPRGQVYAFDAWVDGIEELNTRAMERGLRNIEARAVNVLEGLPLADGSVDACLMATVLHDLVRDNLAERALGECARVLKRGGKLVVVEFKKIEGPPGPPIDIRLTREDVESLIAPFGFTITRADDLGPYHYCVVATLDSK